MKPPCSHAPRGNALKSGYFLYSVGPNGIDDGGRNFFDDHETAEEFRIAMKEEQAWDDIAIRMPPKN